MKPPVLTKEQQEAAAMALWSLWADVRTPSHALQVQTVHAALWGSAPAHWRADRPIAAFVTDEVDA